MKEILMLKPKECGAGNFVRGKFYKVRRIRWLVLTRTERLKPYKYTEENISKYPNGNKWINVESESDAVDGFYVIENDDRFLNCY